MTYYLLLLGVPSSSMLVEKKHSDTQHVMSGVFSLKVPLIHDQDFSNVVHVGLTAFLQRAIPSNFDCTVSTRLTTDSVISLFMMTMHDKANEPSRGSAYIDVRCANRDAAQQLKRTAILTSAISKWLKQHALTQDQVPALPHTSPAVATHEPAEPNDGDPLPPMISSGAEEPPPAAAERDHPVSNHAATSLDSQRPIMWSGAVAFFQQSLRQAGSTSGSSSMFVVIVASAVAVAAAGLLFILRVHSTRRNTKDLQTTGRMFPGSRGLSIGVEGAKDPRQSSASIPSNQGGTSTVNTERFGWQHEWGKPPLHMIQENPDFDWRPFLDDKPMPRKLTFED